MNSSGQLLMVRKCPCLSYTHFNTVYVIIPANLVITLIIWYVQSICIYPQWNSHYHWFLWWIFLMNIYCSWVAQVFFLRNTTHTQKNRILFHRLHNQWCSCRNGGKKTVKEGEAFSLNYQWFEIWSVISGQQNIKIFHIEDIFRMCICVCAH